MSGRTVRIGGASGYWGDASMATPQLLKAGDLDYIVYDYLAEITMSIMARARAKDPAKGYATDFISAVLKLHLPEIARQGTRIIANAGGVNPSACGAAARALIDKLGLDLKVAVILGDDLLDQKDRLAETSPAEMFSARDFPPTDSIASINAYLGAFPIAAALDDGADIVITGRCVDSAVTLGACVHEFGWTTDNHDKLSGGSLAGHILECGPQATGGNYTDWESVAGTIADIGYPIAEISPDGSFLVSKPKGTGGAVTIGTVSEQLVYEIGDPQAYMLPDIVCDFSGALITQDSDNLVRVTGARGSPAPDTYKVSLTYMDGWRGGTMLGFYGGDAEAKAHTYAAAVFKRARRTLRSLNAADFAETSVEIIGSESQFGDFRTSGPPREVMIKLAVRHPEAIGIGILLKEAVGLGLATPPGLSGFSGGRAKPSPVVRLYSFLIPKDEISIAIDHGDASTLYDEGTGEAFDLASIERPAEPEIISLVNPATVPLIKLAWGRSGDKGNKANIGIIARDPAFMPHIWAALTEEIVAKRFAHFLDVPDPSSVERFYMPGPNAINFLLDNVLGGGGIASIRNDAQGKGYAQILLETPIDIPQDMAEALA